MNPLIRPFLLLAFLFSLSACITYQRYQLPKSRLAKIDKDYLSYYLVDPAHPLSRVWYMSECKVEDRGVHCFITRMTEIEASEISLVRNRKDARWSKDDVLFYADPKFAATLQDTSTLTISVDQLEKIDVYEINQIKTIGTPLLTLTGLILVLFLISGE